MTEPGTRVALMHQGERAAGIAVCSLLPATRKPRVMPPVFRPGTPTVSLADVVRPSPCLLRRPVTPGGDRLCWPASREPGARRALSSKEVR